MAKKVATQIQAGNNFKQVYYRPNLQSSVGNKGYEEFESRNQTLANVVEALKDPSVGMVGVWGMGGVGKTMLAKEVARRAKDEEKLFTEVAFITISTEIAQNLCIHYSKLSSSQCLVYDSITSPELNYQSFSPLPQTSY